MIQTAYYPSGIVPASFEDWSKKHFIRSEHKTVSSFDERKRAVNKNLKLQNYIFKSKLPKKWL